MFEAGAFEPLGEVQMNLQHDRLREIASTGNGSLRLLDGPDALRVEADLRPNSAELELVRRGALRGLSVEFRSRVERRESGLRILSKAELPAVALVDSGSYENTVELRALEGAWLRATIPEGHVCSCECAGRECDSVVFDPGSLDALVDGPGDVVAIAGSYTEVLGSKAAGSLLLERTPEGVALGLTEPGTPAAAAVRAAAAVSAVHARPIVNVDASTSTIEGTTRRYSTAAVTAILVKTAPPDRREGWEPAEVDGADPEARRRRIWL